MWHGLNFENVNNNGNWMHCFLAMLSWKQFQIPCIETCSYSNLIALIDINCMNYICNRLAVMMIYWKWWTLQVVLWPMTVKRLFLDWAVWSCGFSCPLYTCLYHVSSLFWDFGRECEWVSLLDLTWEAGYCHRDKWCSKKLKLLTLGSDVRGDLRNGFYRSKTKKIIKLNVQLYSLWNKRRLQQSTQQQKKH